LNKAVFLDRDGTIIRDLSYLSDPEKVQILPKAVPGLKKLQDFGFKLIIVSNQSGVGRGYYTEKDVDLVNKRLLKILCKHKIQILDIYYSCYYKDSKNQKYKKGKEYRKPNAGMLFRAAKEHNIVLSASYIIGDKDSDIGAGINAGLKGCVYIKSSYEYVNKEFIPDKKVRNLNEAAEWIVQNELKTKVICNKKFLKELVLSLKKKNKKIVTTNGVFDILHIGHLNYLKECKRYGNVLIVGINSDDSVKRIKGKKRPIVDQFSRAELVANLKPVDYVFIFEEDDPREFLKIVKPDVHIKSKDYKNKDIIEKKIVEKSGKLVLTKFTYGFSTTQIINKILDVYGKKRK